MDDLLNEAWAWLVKKLLDWALSTFQTFLTWWMSDSAYSVQLTGEKGGVLFMLREYTNWLVAAMAFAGFLVAAFRIAIQRKGEPFRQAMTQFFELAVIILTLATLVNLLNIAGDRYSHWIIEGMGPKGDAWIDNWKNGLDLLGGDQGDTSFILAFFALAAALSSAIQFVLMLFRSGALIILVGILPALAAARFTTYGNAAYRQCVGLLVSFVVVKPVIATIDGGALALMASNYEADRLFGLALAAGSVFALPATMRAVMPAATEGLSFFGIRQVGHFTYGGTAMTMRGRAAGFVTGLLSGGSSGSAATRCAATGRAAVAAVAAGAAAVIRAAVQVAAHRLRLRTTARAADPGAIRAAARVAAPGDPADPVAGRAARPAAHPAVTRAAVRATVRAVVRTTVRAGIHRAPRGPTPPPALPHMTSPRTTFPRTTSLILTSPPSGATAVRFPATGPPTPAPPRADPRAGTPGVHRLPGTAARAAAPVAGGVQVAVRRPKE
ncbi:G-protein coupled receptor [Actinomadura luteofluorescens]|uniref:G-protein coupled receptor n=1 Tax=Actinomadura luteofluorescens TaxID=46163 RepID=UPI003627310A